MRACVCVKEQRIQHTHTHTQEGREGWRALEYPLGKKDEGGGVFFFFSLFFFSMNGERRRSQPRGTLPLTQAGKKIYEWLASSVNKEEGALGVSAKGGLWPPHETIFGIRDDTRLSRQENI